MARLWIMSNLHHEARSGRYWQPPARVDHDVVVLAGDVHRDPISAAAWCTYAFEKPVVYVFGNHEFYWKRSVDEVIADGRASGSSAARYTNEH